MEELTKVILEKVNAIEDIKKVSDHLVFFEGGGSYTISFLYPNDKERITALKPVFDEITSVFGRRIHQFRPKQPKLKTHYQTPRFNTFENVMRPQPKTLYLTYQIWLKPEGE